MAEGHVSMSGTLISQKPVIAEQREEVVETIKSVEQPHVSMRGQLITKRIQEAVDVIQGGIQAMEQPQPASEDPDRQFYQSFRQGITPEAMTMEPTTDQPIPEKPDVEVKELPDAPAASGVQPPTKKDDAPLNVRNNNLGNIKNIQANEWVGQTNLGTDETFANFETPQLGVRALTKVVQANINATNTFEEYVNRYASEPDEKDYYAKNGELMPHLKNYGSVIAASQGINDVKENIPEDINMLEWIKATARAEGGSDALSYFTDDIIKEGIELAGKE